MKLHKPKFYFVIGGSASGKNHWIDKNLSHLPLVDIDQIILEWSDGDPNKDRVNLISPAIREAQDRMGILFDFEESFVHVSTGTNLKGTLNKFIRAKTYDFETYLIIIETSDTIAVARNHMRIKSGGHGNTLTDEKVIKTNSYARQNFLRLMNFECVDNVKAIKNEW